MPFPDQLLTVPDARTDAVAQLVVGLARKMLVEHNLETQFERSVKITETGVFWNRFLVGIDANELARSAASVIAQELSMPPDLTHKLARNFDSPSSVLLGFEEQAGVLTYRVYLEFWEKVAAQARSGDASPRLLNLGFKWNVANPAETAVTEYYCRPLLPLAKIRARVAELFRARESGLGSAIDAIVLTAAKTMARPGFVYMEATEHNARSSFDLNLYPANVSLAEVADEVATIASLLGRQTQDLAPYYQHYKYATVGHISGGYDRSGAAFFTLYFEEV